MPSQHGSTDVIENCNSEITGSKLREKKYEGKSNKARIADVAAELKAAASPGEDGVSWPEDVRRE